jgi:uncharacterized protein YggE
MEPFTKDLKHMGTTFAIKISVIGVLAILALFLFVQTMSAIQTMGMSTTPPTNTIVVTGEGSATAIPDTATISFGVTATAADVASAQTKVTGILTKALEGVKASGVAEADITTTSFSVSPHYTSPTCSPGVMCTAGGPSTVSGYDVSENVSVKVRDTKKVATLLDGLAKANVSNVDGPNFVVGDTQALLAKARGEAIQKAQQDAQTLAGQLGVHLVKIVSFSDSTGPTPPQPMYKAASMGVATDAAAPVVPTGQNTYSDTVSITYEIR